MNNREREIRDALLGKPNSGTGNGRPRRPPIRVDADAPKLTDLGNAERLIARHGADLLHVHPWQKWLVWDGRRWKADDTGEVERRAADTVRAMYAAAAAELDPDRRSALAQHATRSEAASRLAAMVKLAASLSGVPALPDEFDADPWLLNCPNGTVDLRTGELRDHSRADRLTALCPTPYVPDAGCPTWERFLASVFPATGDAAEAAGDVELIRYVQRLLGYGATGSVREHVLSVFYGGGSNGKTVMLETAHAVLGSDYAMQAAPEFLIHSRADRHPTELADLFRKRLVVASESREGGSLNEDLVKRLTGGDTIRARRMREDFWEFAPTHKLILATNHKPAVRGGDEGIWRRLRLVPFAVKFWDPDRPPAAGEDRPAALRQDKGLTGKLRGEAAGILAWLVRGCLDWQRHGLGAPQAVAGATAEYREEQDLVGQFLAERCVTGSEYRAKSSDLYAAFQRYVEAAGERRVPRRQEFGEAMTRREFERYTNNGTWYRGVALAVTEPTEPDGSRFPV
jgi:putative DNA primase/helicase